MDFSIDLAIRVLVAGLAGGLIGYERELRGKVAGIRTHFLVAMGSALFMIISLFGFPEGFRFDAARVAAGVVGGLGFLGGGIIMKNRHVSGLTTAAGIWVTGAIGLSIGAGMYEVSGLCLVLLLLCMEALHHLNIHIGDRQINTTLSAASEQDLLNALQLLGKHVGNFSMFKQGEVYKAEVSMLIKKKDYPNGILQKIKALPGITMESLD